MKGPCELHALSIKSSEPDSDLDYEIELIPFLISIKVMTETGAWQLRRNAMSFNEHSEQVYPMGNADMNFPLGAGCF